MLPEVPEQCDDDVSEGGRGEDEGKVCPTERGEVAGEKSEEAEDSCDDPGIAESYEEEREIVE